MLRDISVFWFLFEIYNKKIIVIHFPRFDKPFLLNVLPFRPPLCSSGQSSWLQIQRSRVRFLALRDFLRSSGSGTASTQPREDN
jgi:hypothetical protein